MAVVPHKKNEYRPHLLRVRGIVAFIIFIVAIQFLYAAAQDGKVLGSATGITPQSLLDQTNDRRLASGVGALTISPKLSQAAEAKATDMFQKNYWAHVSPSGVTPWVWMKDQDYAYSVAGENLAKNFTTTGGVIAAWMNSAEHRKNMLDSRYRDVGFAAITGTLDGKRTRLVVAMYGRPTGEAGVPAGVLAATQDSLNVLGRIGVGLQQLNPAALASIFLLLGATVVGFVAHSQRAKLPKKWRSSWQRHHGFYTSLGFMGLIMMTIALYGTGQI